MSWDNRYDTEEYVYGTEPNDYLASMLNELPGGQVLCPAEGEGRNAVWLAQRGWLGDKDLEGRPDLPSGHVDYGAVIPWKFRLLDRAWKRFRDHGGRQWLEEGAQGDDGDGAHPKRRPAKTDQHETRR